MFENFVIFTEVVKLSRNTFHELKEVNYSVSVAYKIYKKRDISAFEQIIDLIEDEKLINSVVNFLPVFRLQDGRRWLGAIFKVIRYVTNTNSRKMLLFKSTQHGILEYVKYFVETGIDFKIKNHALSLACIYGYLDIVTYLIENGASLIKQRQSCLGLAVSHGRFETVKYLIEKDVNSNNNSMLLSATQSGNLEIVKYLVGKGAVDNEFNEALISAIRNNYFDIARYLIERHPQLNSKYKN